MADATLTADERILLKELPFKVIFAAVVSDVRGAVGSAQLETLEAAKALVADAVTNYQSNPIIMGVLQDVANDPADEESIVLKDEDARAAALVDSLRISSEGAGILATLADQDQALQYKEWVVNAAHAATEATRSGSIFNRSHTSNAEEDFLRQVKVALGLITQEIADDE